MSDVLPDFNRLVLARLEGASHHTGDFPGWHREGWAFMIRWENGAADTIADGWARYRYDQALTAIDADYASVKEWVYVDEIGALSHRIAELEAERDSIGTMAKERGYVEGWDACETTMVPRARDEALEEAIKLMAMENGPERGVWIVNLIEKIRALKGTKP